eukprot:SAG31_NODE_19689_length_594_cov_1.236364_1_plen_46_part_00
MTFGESASGMKSNLDGSAKRKAARGSLVTNQSENAVLLALNIGEY